MRLEHLYRLRFSYTEGWEVGTGGPTRQRFGLAEGRCDGRIAGRFRGGNHARVRTDGVVLPDVQGFITTDDGATLLCDYRGRGRTLDDGSFEVVATAIHVSGDERYAHLNDVVCAIEGGSGPADEEVEIEVYELVWEEVAE